MKTFRYPILVAAGSALLAGFSTNAIGQSTVIKQDTASMAANAINWSAPPGTTDYGSFGSALSTANAATLDLEGNLTLGRLIFTNASNGPLVIGNTGTLTLGNAVAIDARFSNQSITIHAPIVINTAGNTFEADNSLTTTLAFTNTITSAGKITWRAGTGVFSGGGSYTAMDIGSRSGILSTVRLGAHDGLAANAALTIGTANGSAQFDLAGFNQTLAGITKGTQSAAIGNSSTTSDSTLTITGTSTFGGSIQDSIGAGSRKLSLTVDGGNLTLTNANTFSGNTIIREGTLKLDGAGGIASSSRIVVGTAGSSGATLDLSTKTGPLVVGTGSRLEGIGLIAGASATTDISGIHAPGDGLGKQIFAGNLSYAGGSIFEWQVSSGLGPARGTGYDAVDISGSLTIGNGAIFRVKLDGSELDNNFWDSPRTWSDIFAGQSATSGGFSSGALQVFVDGSPADIAARGGFTISGTELQWTPVPEYGTFGPGLAACIFLLYHRRRP